MPVGSRELRRGIDLGVYPDFEREQREERRVQIAERAGQRAEARETRVAANDDVRLRLEALRFENDAVKTRAAAMAEERVLTDSIEATKKLAGIPATTAEFPTLLQKIVSEHPRALSDKAFQEQYDWNAGLHKEWLTQRQASDKLAEQRRYDEAQKAAEKLAIQEARKQSIEGLVKGGANPKSATVGVTGEPSATFEFGQEPVDQGTIRTSRDAKGKVTVSTTRPLVPGAQLAEERAALLAEHNALEAALMARSGETKPTKEEITAINTIKGQLGYRMIDASGKAAQEQSGSATAQPASDPSAPVKNQAALEWLAANPSDPRAAAVKAKLGIQ